MMKKKVLSLVITTVFSCGDGMWSDIFNLAYTFCDPGFLSMVCD